jgi:UDP-N-acetylmuramyl pentapeptide synthase
MLKQSFVILTLTYFRVLAKLQLRKNRRAVIIGITGSAGKSSTRSALALILRSVGRVKESTRANSASGIPLNILGLSPINYSLLDWCRLVLLAPLMLLVNWRHFDYYVVEMGIDSPLPPHNMSYLLSIIRPHVAIVLGATLAHSVAFDHLVKDRDPTRRAKKLVAEIAREKFKLALGVDPSGVAVVNTDQPEFRSVLKDCQARVIKLGRLRSASFRFDKPSISRQGFDFTFSFQGQDHTLHLPDAYDANYSYSFAAAIAAATALGISPTRSLQQLAGYQAPAGRMRLFPGIRGGTIIDSSYNSSPATIKSALTLLHQIAGKRPKLVVLGDMRELGKESKQAHRELATWVERYADQAVLFGPELAAHTLPRLQTNKFPVHHFFHMSGLTTYLRQHLPSRAVVLIKGSQDGIYLERAVQAILRDSQDSRHLCRRGKYWDNLRRASN